MLPLFSYFFNPNSNSGKDAFNQAKDQVGSKGLLRKSIAKIINSAASICGLRQRSARAYECGPLFQFAIAFTTEGKREANFKLSNYIGTIIRESVWHLSISSNAVTKRLSKAGTPDFLRAMLDMYNRIIMHKRPKYGFTTAADMLCKLARVADCLTIDGTYIDVLRSDNYDCRAGDGKYGLGLHCLTSLMTGTIVGFSVTPAACNERLYVQIEQLANVLIMAGRGYPSFQIFADLIRRGASHGVKFIFRAVPCFTMDVLNAVNADGQPVNLTAVNGAVDTSNRANHTIDMIVRMHCPKDSKVKEKTLKLRVVRVYRPHDGSWTYYVTNIDQSDMPPRMFPHAYRLRLVCEHVYRCAKSYTGMAQGINSRKFNVVLFFIVASICAMILKALMASYMRPRQGKALSLLKLHEKTGNLGSLIGKIMNYKVIDALKEIRSMAAGLTCQCLTSPVSKRDKHRVASFQEVYVRLKAVLEEDRLKLELCCAVS